MEKVSLNSLVENLVPEYVREEYPLLVEFLKEYYISQETSGQSLDLIQNLAEYVKIDNLTNLVDSCNLTASISYYEKDIFVDTTRGFPSSQGLIQINDEVIFYDRSVEEEPIEFVGKIDIGFNEITSTEVEDTTSTVGWYVRVYNLDESKFIGEGLVTGTNDGNNIKVNFTPVPSLDIDGYETSDLYICKITRSKFTGCRRGFSGVTGLKDSVTSNKLIFTSTKASKHKNGDVVTNLNIILLKEFFRKIKVQIAPGFENEEFYDVINESTFVKNIKEFYRSKGSECSFDLLFKALYGKPVDIVIPSNYLVEPSSSRYSITKNLIVELIEGDASELENRTLYQDTQFNIPNTRGIITKLEKLQKDNKDFYRLYIDNSIEENYDSTYGNFTIHPKTKNTTRIEKNQTFVDVDSTIGFPLSGTLVLKDDFNLEYRVEYTSKTSTQFLGCTGLTRDFEENSDINLDVYSYVNVTGGQVKVRVTGVLDNSIESTILPSVKNLRKNDYLPIKTLGTEIKNDPRSSSWIYNIPKTYQVKSIELLDNTDFAYRVYFYEKHDLSVGQNITLTPVSDISGSYNGAVVEWNNQFSVIVRGSRVFLNENIKYDLEKKLNKSNFDGIINYPADVQNTYYDRKTDDIYVNSQSLPLYRPSFEVEELNVNKRIRAFSGIFKDQDTLDIGKHGFITGDAVVYKPRTVSYIPSYTLDANGVRSYKFINNETGDYENNPTLVLIRGKKYTFRNDMNQHPFRIQIESNGTVSDQYNDGIKNNDVSNGVLVWEVQEDTPDVLYYQCLNHQAMGGVINIIDEDEQKSLDIDKGIYFIEKVSPTQIKLYRSRTNIVKGQSVKFSGVVIQDTIESYDYVYKNLDSRKIEPQDIIRKIVRHPGHENSNVSAKITESGTIGIWRNGIELLNYKSKDFISYGQIKSLDVLSKGSGYDVINVPYLRITDPNGSGCVSNLSVKGYLSRIDILDKGFDYIETPVIKISGGNGTGAKAEVELEKYVHFSTFNASEVDLVNDSIGFSTYHKFKDGESIQYETLGQVAIAGLSTSSYYFVSLVDSYNVKLHKSKSDALDNRNPINLYQIGTGKHNLKSTNRKNRVKRVNISQNGYGYEQKYRSCPSSGISTYKDLIEIKDHGYQSGEIVTYNPKIAPVAGLSSGTDYYVLKNDDDSFRLCAITGISTQKDIFYKQKKYINFDGFIEGDHTFKYQDIVVTIEGRSSLSQEDLNADTNARIRPIFSGEIDSVFIENGGQKYGSQVSNFVSQPNIQILQGRNARLKPIIKNGEIISVIIQDPGKDYYSTPDVSVIGTGVGANLIPIVKDGYISDIIIENPGIGYQSEGTQALVVNRGISGSISANIQTWRINLVERYVSTGLISPEDSFLYEGKTKSRGIQYVHTYAPRKLREISLASRFLNGVEVFNPDLELINGVESVSLAHSPILGWAYDGNPIYGPYAYSSQTGGRIIQMTSGYELRTDLNKDKNRPNLVDFPPGFFIEDYTFTGNGTLDKHNGRYCVTPDYPNGVYAYFCTVNTEVDSNGLFKSYRRPVFPYVIGNAYISSPTEFNFKSTSTLEYFDLNTSDLTRNTAPYSLLADTINYPYLKYDKAYRNQNAIVKSTKFGSVTSVGIVTGGYNYKVGDRVVFDGQIDTFKAKGMVSKVKGVDVESISLLHSESQKCNIIKTSKVFTAFTEDPHGYTPGESVTLTFNNELLTTTEINVKFNIITLKQNLDIPSVTGIVTHISVATIFDLIYPNDVYELNNEKIKVLRVESNKSRLLVQREYDGSIGSTHQVSSGFIEVPRKFTFSPQNSFITTSFTNSLENPLYFIPSENVGLNTVTINISNHPLITGDLLDYSNEGGTSITVENENGSFLLSDVEQIYAVKINSNLIGLTTVSSGITTDPQLLLFTNVGLGSVHSLTPRYSNVLECDISDDRVLVTTSTPHGLSVGDRFDLYVESGISTTYKVEYNKRNRAVIIGRRDFESSDVNTLKNFITIENHKYQSGQQVIYLSSNPAITTGLDHDKVYYVSAITSNRIKLAEQKYDALLGINAVDITASLAGSILPINSPLEVVKYEDIIFDLSDSSLSIDNEREKEAFDFRLYWDHMLTHEFYTTAKQRSFDLTYNGSIGISSDAKATLRNSSNLPKEIYYNLVPKRRFGNNTENLELYTYKNRSDDGYINNSINVVDSKFSNTYKINSNTSNTFTAPIFNDPERYEYTSGRGNVLNYFVKSPVVEGSIAEIEIQSRGEGYKSIPKIDKIVSENGSGAILKVESNNIGTPLNIEFDDIGYDYYSDNTIRPSSKTPTIIELDYLSSVKEVKVISPGKNYSTAPDIIIIDGYTNKLVEDLEFKYNIFTRKVDIIKNTYNLSEYSPKILTINNSNGIGINTITFNEDNKHVTVELSPSYSFLQDFPFEIGDKVLVENVSVGIATTGKGYNSENYNYTTFTIIDRDPALGGIGATVTYSLQNLLGEGESPGKFNVFNSVGRIVPLKYLPTFEIETQKSKFFSNEPVVGTSGARGNIQSIDYDRDIIKVYTLDDFKVGDVLRGLVSGRRSRVLKVVSDEIDFPVTSGSVVRNGWSTRKGFLNDPEQRIHDSDYYQYFSYSVKSEVDYETWNPYVSNLVHTVGFKKFSDILVPSEPNSFVGIETIQSSGDISGIADIHRVIDVDCYQDFDTITETTSIINETRKSKEVILRSRLLQDYIESIGNRVLELDDISSEFNQVVRSTRYSTIDAYERVVGFRKYFVIVENIDNPYERQAGVVLLLSDGLNVFNVDYAKLFPQTTIGDFDAEISGTEVLLRFFPISYKTTNYLVFVTSLEIDASTVGVGSISESILGDAVHMYSEQIPSIGPGVSEVFRLSLNDTTNKLIIHVGADNGYVQTEELIITTDGTDLFVNEYGFLNSSGGGSDSTPGIATFTYSIDGSEIIVTGAFDSPNSNEFQVDASITAFSSTNTGVGTAAVNGALLETTYTSFSASPTPTASTLSSFGGRYDATYVIASVQDLTNGTHYAEEFVVMSTWNKQVDYVAPIVSSGTDTGIGTFGAISNGSTCSIVFTPEPNIDVDVRTFEYKIGYYDQITTPEQIIDLGNMKVDSGFGDYEGTELSIKKSFELYHKEQPLFQKTIDATQASQLDIDNNIISTPGHYFVTGEELDYSYRFSDVGLTDNAISIASTTVPGIGLTDKLPTTVYAVKVDELSIQVAASASDALAFNPKIFEFASLGITTDHKFTSKKQNTRTLISLDNIVQSPVVSSGTTALLAIDSTPFNAILEFQSVDGFQGGDLIQIDNEIMRIFVIGFNDNPNFVYCTRGFIGTKRNTHPAGSVVTKVTANYNIVGNTIYFPEAPFGNIQFENSLNKPDEVDYFGIDVRSKFNGRVFLRSSSPGSQYDPYNDNFILDTVSDQFNGYDDEFTIQSLGSNVTGIASLNAAVLVNNVFQVPDGPFNNGNYSMLEVGGETKIKFTGFSSTSYYDINQSGLPRGRIILSVGSTAGLGYQPLVSAGGTATISGTGSISNISIGNSGSGYRSGIQTYVKIGVVTTSLDSDVEYIGFATVYNGSVVSIAITNPGTGYTSSNPPQVIFDDPEPYWNIPLQYQAPSSGLGTEAYVDLVVSQDSSVLSFEVRNYGYGFNVRDLLTVPVGGETGIPTTSDYGAFEYFTIIVDRLYADDFSAWHFGELQPIDSIQDLIDGSRRFFPIYINGQQTTIRSKPGSGIEVKSTLLVFVNDILQVPDEGYIFENGSIIEFPVPLEIGTKVDIVFYRGSGSVDTRNVDIIEPIEKGDLFTINSDNPLYLQNERQVFDIVNTNTVETIAYPGPGLDQSESIIRPIALCQQKNDIAVNGGYVGKSRSIYEPYISPVARVIDTINTTSTDIYVDGVKIFFDDLREYSTEQTRKQTITVVSQESITSAAGTAIVSTAGTITGVVISNSGLGYTFTPSASIPNPDNLTFTNKNNFYTNQTVLQSSISNGSVDSITVVSSGSGYTATNPPQVIIESPRAIYEVIENVSYEGDFGDVIQINNGNTYLDLDLFVPLDSYLRDTDVASVGVASTGLSALQVGDYFILDNTNVGDGITSRDTTGTVNVSIGNSFLDNVYQVQAVSTVSSTVPGVGVTFVTRVRVNVDSSTNNAPVGVTTRAGTYTWGKITNLGRRMPMSFVVNSNRLSGINTSPVVVRKNRLDYKSYL
jgi:hypothetical protein